jgi:hypothetical protein
MMSKALVLRLARRALVLAATVAVLGVAVGTVQLAAQWRAEAAPIDAAPAGMNAIARDYTAESERTKDLSNQLDGVAHQISDLQVALIAANGSIGGETDSATALKGQLATAKTKLGVVQRQLKLAQARLAALNAAAARQAAINRSAGVRRSQRTTTRTQATQRPEPRETREPRETDEPEDPDRG